MKPFELKRVVRWYYISGILEINTVSPFEYSVKIDASIMLFLRCLT
jgi:hypothetical protein